MSPTPSRYADLTREELARLLPELLLIGQLIDRSGMAWCIQSFGRQAMTDIAIEEWAGSSPIYTRRMQRAGGRFPQPLPGPGHQGYFSREVGQGCDAEFGHCVGDGKGLMGGGRLLRVKLGVELGGCDGYLIQPIFPE